MKKQQRTQQLRQFFTNGGRGTNQQIANTFGISTGAVRGQICLLRGQGMEIVKVFPNASSRLTVYGYVPGIREALTPVRGRPFLPK